MRLPAIYGIGTYLTTRTGTLKFRTPKVPANSSACKSFN